MLSPRNSIDPYHHLYASFKVDYIKGITNVQGIKLEFPMHKQQQKYISTSNLGLGPSRLPGFPVYSHLPKTTKLVQELPLLAPQLPPGSKYPLEGGRNITGTTLIRATEE
jgi:hypothetical protein